MVNRLVTLVASSKVDLKELVKPLLEKYNHKNLTYEFDRVTIVLEELPWQGLRSSLFAFCKERFPRGGIVMVFTDLCSRGKEMMRVTWNGEFFDINYAFDSHNTLL